MNYLSKSGQILLGVLLFTALGANAEVDSHSVKDRRDPRYYTLSEIRVREISNSTWDQALQDTLPECKSGAVESSMNPSRGFGNLPRGFVGVSEGLDVVGLIVDKIVNIGSSLWNIIDRGRPTAQIYHQVGTALPAGTPCWTHLQSWGRPVAKTFQVTYKNGFGSQVLSFKYRVMAITGGNVHGIGKYIGYATLLPQELKLSWGWDFQADVAIPAVVNLGTHEEPLAGMQLELSYRVSNARKIFEGSSAYFLDGNGRVDLIE